MGVIKFPVLSNNDIYDFDANCELVAGNRGCIVVYPASNELQIDIDSDDDYERFLAAIPLLDFTREVTEKVSMSGLPHRHIYVKANRTFTDIERIAYQFMLGSDYVRESLNLMRVTYGVKNPTRLFESKEAANE